MVAQRLRVLRGAGQEPTFRGQPSSYWRQRIKQGDVSFGGFTSSLFVSRDGKLELFLLPWEPESKEVVPVLLDLLQDQDAGVRWVAATGLGTYADKEEATPPLIEMLDDEDEDVREAAAKSLQRMNADLEPQVEQAVAAILKQAESRGPISFGASSLTDAELEQMLGWTHLRGLNASHTEVTDAGLAHLAGLRQLTHLQLAGTRVSDAGLVHLGKMTGLAFLDLSGTQVSDAGLAHLKGLTNLRQLDVTGTAVTAVGARDLQEALPKLRVVR
jgi:hypothetical protein